jgi:hypothetical protein
MTPPIGVMKLTLLVLYSQRISLGRKQGYTNELTFHMGNVLHTTPHLPMNQVLSNPPDTSAREGWSDPGLWIFNLSSVDIALGVTLA